MLAKHYLIVLSFAILSVSPENVFGFEDSVKLKTTLDSLVIKIAAYNKVDNEAISESGYKSEQFKRFEQLLEIASIEELVKLSNNKNSTVRTYVIWALAKHNYKDLNDVLNKHSNDNGRVTLQLGCKRFNLKVKETFSYLLAAPQISNSTSE